MIKLYITLSLLFKKINKSKLCDVQYFNGIGVLPEKNAPGQLRHDASITSSVLLWLTQNVAITCTTAMGIFPITC